MKKRCVRVACALVVLSLTWAGPTAAQTVTGDVAGRVLDASAAALPGVTVTIQNIGQPAPQSAVTSETGAFRFASLAPGTYRVSFELAGFKTLVLEEVRVNVSQTTDVSPKLEISTVQETVTVSAAAAVVDTTAVKTGQTFNRDFLEGIPTARDPWVILEQTPGLVMNQQNVGGNKSGQQSTFVARGAQLGNTMWNVDGVTITDMAATGSSSVYYDFDAFEQIQVTTGGQDASMQTGGINLNMITKSGTNRLRGSSRLLITDEKFQDDNMTDALRAQNAGSGNPIQDIRDYGLEIGGPIVTNKMWFWAGYGAQDIRVGVTGFKKPTAECQAVPNNAPAAQIRPCLNSDLTLLDNYNTKINGNLGNAHRWNVFYNFSDKVRNSRDVAPNRTFEAASKQLGPTNTYRGTHQWIANDRLVIDSSASFVDGGFQLTFTQPEFESVQPLVDLGTGLNSRSRFLDDNIRPQYAVQQDANLFLSNLLGGDNALKLGWKWRRTPVERYVRRGGEGIAVARNDASVEFTAARDLALLMDLTTTSGYLQNTYTRDRLSVNLGVRADYQDDSLEPRSVRANPMVPALLPAVDFGGADTGITWLDVSPRAGLTYDVFGSARTILKASAAAFYGQGLFLSGDLNPVTEVLLTFPWADQNGDLVAQANELDLTRPRLDGGNFDPANPSSPTTRNVVDPDTRNDRTREVLVGIDQQITRTLGVSAMYIYRKLDRFQIIERIGLTNEDFVPVTTTIACGNPGGCTQDSYTVDYFQLRAGLSRPAAQLTTNQDAWRVFHGLEFALNKRYANKWLMNASVALNSAKNYFGDGEHAFFDPTNIAAQHGRDALAQNARWVAKMNGMYTLPYAINVSGTFNAREGFPFNPVVLTPLRAGGLGRVNVNVEPLGTQRLENFYQLDLGVDKAFTFDRYRVSVHMDVFNALNANTVLARNGNYHQTTAGNVQEILAPRVVRFGVRMRF